jgi:hypothetical protein
VQAAQGLFDAGEERLEFTPAPKAKGKEPQTVFLGQIVDRGMFSIAGTRIQRPFDTDAIILALPAPSLGGPNIAPVERRAKVDCHGYLVFVRGLLSTVAARTGPGL